MASEGKSKSKPSLMTVGQQVAGAIWRGVTDPNTSVVRKMNVLGGFLASGMRLANATVIGKLGARPEKTLVVWDAEGDAGARAVREALSTLDLDAEVRPCPRGGKRFSSELEGRDLPQLRDPNTGETLNGAEDIVRHLYARYGVTAPPALLTSAGVRGVTGASVQLFTAGRGTDARPSRTPKLPLELYSFEASPYCRFARAALCELELPYTLHNVAKGSKRRKAFIERAGKMQVPWLHDPNTGKSLFESQEIEKYLQANYGTE